jgi:hypothetical protein
MIRGVLNFHLKVLMIRQRNISTSVRREMVNVAVSIFGLEEADTKALVKHANDHYAYLLRLLRQQFQAALDCFLKDSCTEEFCEYARTGAKWGRFNNSSSPLLSCSKLNEMFFNGNYRLLWDIWVPILDVLPDEEYMMVGNPGEKWSAALLESTLHVLNWMITHHLGGSDSTAEMTQE